MEDLPNYGSIAREDDCGSVLVDLIRNRIWRKDNIDVGHL